MWFGDLVTMKWWDDLWLNESFASWMTIKVLDDVFPEQKAGTTALYPVQRAMSIDLAAVDPGHAREGRGLDQPRPDRERADVRQGQVPCSPCSRAGSASEPFRAGVLEYLKAHEWGTPEAKRSVDARSGPPRERTSTPRWPPSSISPAFRSSASSRCPAGGSGSRNAGSSPASTRRAIPALWRVPGDAALSHAAGAGHATRAVDHPGDGRGPGTSGARRPGSSPTPGPTGTTAGTCPATCSTRWWRRARGPIPASAST